MQKRVVYAFDDNPQTIVDIEEAIERVGLDHGSRLRSATDEDASMKLVQRHRKSKSKSAPLFIVDLRIRDAKSGLRLLKAIRKRRSLRYAPVVVVSSSNDQSSINSSYENGATGYVVKHDDPDEFGPVLDSMIRFWASAAAHEPVQAKK